MQLLCESWKISNMSSAHILRGDIELVFWYADHLGEILVVFSQHFIGKQHLGNYGRKLELSEFEKFRYNLVSID